MSHGIFQITGYHARGMQVYDVLIYNDGNQNSAPSEQYSGLSQNDVMKQARTCRGYRPIFISVRNGVQDDVKKRLRLV